MDKALDLINRDLSWLEFNRRVLQEAEDERTPLLERLRFLMIFQSNLDEFYMKRVGALHRQFRSNGNAVVTFKKIRKEIDSQLALHSRIFRSSLMPSLQEEGIALCRWDELSKKEKKKSGEFFEQRVFPILTPLAVDPGHPFPFLSNLSVSMGVLLRNPAEAQIEGEDRLFARIKVPRNVPQWFQLPSDASTGYRFVSLTEIISNNLEKVFPEMKILDVMAFRITRNADLERDEADADDLLEMIEEEIHQRRFARVIRLEHGSKPNAWMRRFLIRELELKEDDVYETSGVLDYQGLRSVVDLPLSKLKFQSFQGVVPVRFQDESASIFSLIKSGDVLVHHPYESFTASVERFIREAANDSKVLAIKMTLYRTSEDSPIVNALIHAAESGKHVVCLVELKARFDEERNIHWAEKMEEAGVHVVYGIVGMKTHTKLALVVRSEGEKLRSYCHIGTGNYNSQTARVYTDFGLFTIDPEISADVIELFNFLTGRSLKRNYERLLVAPVNMKNRFLRLIQREMENAIKGKPARIVGKMNSLEDVEVIQALLKASQKGVEIELIVRGFCCLRPGVPGVSEKIRVMSVIGRFLEHSRVFYFQNESGSDWGGDFYIGSADWMHRNLGARVEAVVPIREQSLRERLASVLQLMLDDRRQTWEMKSDGTYFKKKRASESVRSDEAQGVQRLLIEAARSGNADIPHPLKKKP